MTVDVLPNHPTPTHHVSLTDGVTTIGLIAAGQNLAPDPLTIGRSPVDRNPLKTSSGNNKYSDFNYPYAVIAQDNFSGGRGQNLFSNDATRFYDSYRMQTDRAGKFFLGGLEEYADITGFIGAMSTMAEVDQAMPGVLLYGAEKYHASKVTVAALTGDVAITAWVKKVGNPTGLTIGLYTDVAGSPDALVGTALGAYSESGCYEPVRIVAISGSGLSAGTYWIVVNSTTADPDNYYVLCTYSAPAGPIIAKTSADGTIFLNGRSMDWFLLIPKN